MSLEPCDGVCLATINHECTRKCACREGHPGECKCLAAFIAETDKHYEELRPAQRVATETS